MDKYRFLLASYLQDAKRLYNLQHNFEPKTLLSISSDTKISTSNLSKIFSGAQVPTLLSFLKILDSLHCRIIVEPFDSRAAFPELFKINNHDNK